MEIFIIKQLQSLSSNFLDILCELISFFSNYSGFIIIILIIFLFFNNKYSFFFGITYGIGIGINYILKFIINRPRPYIIDSDILNKLPAIGSSFPSGHSVSATIIVCFLFYIVYKTKKKSAKIIYGFIFAIFILLVAFSRMYLGQHYLSDVISGIIFGLIYSYFGILCYNKSKVYDGYQRHNL